MKLQLSSEEIIERSYQVIALLTLCETASGAIKNGAGDFEQVADGLGVALQLAKDLHASVHDFIEIREVMKPAP